MDEKLYNAGLDFKVFLWRSGYGWERLPGPYNVRTLYNGRETVQDSWIHPNKKFAPLYTNADPALTYAIGKQVLAGEEYSDRIALIEKSGRTSSDDPIRLCSDTGEYLDVLQQFDWTRTESIRGFANIGSLIGFVKRGETDAVTERLYGVELTPQQMVDAYKETFCEFDYDADSSSESVKAALKMLRSGEVRVEKITGPVGYALLKDFFNSIRPVTDLYGSVRVSAETIKWSTKRNLEVTLVDENEQYRPVGGSPMAIRTRVDIDDGSVITT